ncbi:hypothetical protein [Natranaerobius trueperi]|uniref:Uncharacterized protein n=1 Tax=Natranaerobius trueperi TaxID=759412 RepID=A0A226C0V5_9FIRM|nr:hypothetical protein [Natranaerobius trueperi]OWZ84815.1 hypothetical protein CDO51_02015 [Natranaerobius trueperi]
MVLILVQFNYLDEHHQAGIKGIKYAVERDIGVAIMEPLRGVRLAQNQPPKVMDIINSASVQRTPAEWGLTWVLDHP